MKRVVDFLGKILNLFLKPYAYVPVICAVVFNSLTYSGTKVILEAKDTFYFDLSLPIDGQIPFWTGFIFIYVLAYVQWFTGWLLNTRESREVCYHVCMSNIIAKAICLVFFLALPTMIERPEVPSGGFANFVTTLIYHRDTPINLFPSVHCVESWCCFRGALLNKWAPKWVKWAELVFSLGVFASTVFVKQHFLVDIFAGVAAVEIGYFVSSKTRAWRFFEKIELPIVRREREREAAENAEQK